MQFIDIQSYSYDERAEILPVLLTSFADCGGWVLKRNTLSRTNIEFHLEIQLRSVLDLYAAILSSGVELTRDAHRALADLCTCRQHLKSSNGLNRVVSVRIEISFLEDVTLHSLLNTLIPPA